MDMPCLWRPANGLAATMVDVSGTTLVRGTAGLVGEVGFGGTYNRDTEGSLPKSAYGEFAVSTNLGDMGTDYGIRGTAGVRVSW
jgi:hypothetical protein